ncbi:hypothetical protein C2845_PM18G03670 [Panicum miliaceum]|uniref:Uncharacterized protein n=1 Tax=Panicum miliaceum TaxID=4540 RepID=A0A3L6PLQ1_PANMI|nr:hypothetical protein C2845_PM18G03670 [Panicum miliaceum]
MAKHNLRHLLPLLFVATVVASPSTASEGVTGYVLRPDGSFEVYLPGDCNIHAANMQIKYSSRIAGNIQAQSIRGLEGVKVEMMLVWIGVTQVTRTDDQLNFFVGPISKSFPIGNFANSPHCNS